MLRTQSWAFDGSVIVADTSYDERGRVAQTYQPRVVGAAAILASRQAYDDLDRVTSTVTLNDDGAEIGSSTQYQGLTTVLTSARGHSKTEKRDVRGKLASSLDAGGGTTYYQHDAFGNLMRTQDPAGNVVTVGYDTLGRRVWLNDPDLGTIVYNIDPLGQVWLQTSPLQRAASTGSLMSYDALGRMIKRSEPDLTSYWNYDVIPGQSDCQALKSCGQLVQAYTQDASGKVDYLRQARFDALGRPSSGEIRLDTIYSNSITYDSLGRPQTQSYQRQGGAVKQFTHRYNVRGYQERIERGALVLWRATAQDASARVTNAALGNGLNVARTYNPYTGHLSFGSLGNAQAQNQLSESYNYDALGNVKQRAQYWPGQGFTEDFEYDGLNRLTVAVVSGQFGQYFHYDAVGNMLSKTGVGTGNYVYPAPGSARPHAVSSIPGIGDFHYDANGNLLSGANRTVSWTSFDMPRTISRGSESSAFVYGPEHQRARQDRSDSMTTYYAGPMEVEISNGATRVKTYWPMGLGVEIDQPSGATELNWTHLDRLGSVVAISDAAGVLKEKLAYDSWGKRRTLDGGATPDELDGVTDNRGYTGHEMLEKLDLVHMNGRVYDPLVARFMSPDPIIQDAHHSQSYNRYTYVWNNPKNLTDPSGFLAAEMTNVDYIGGADSSGGGHDIAVLRDISQRNINSLDRSGIVMQASAQSASNVVYINGCRACERVEKFLLDTWLSERARAAELRLLITGGAAEFAGAALQRAGVYAFIFLGAGNAFQKSTEDADMAAMHAKYAQAIKDKEKEVKRDSAALSNGTDSEDKPNLLTPEDANHVLNGDHEGGATGLAQGSQARPNFRQIGLMRKY